VEAEALDSLERYVTDFLELSRRWMANFVLLSKKQAISDEILEKSNVKNPAAQGPVKGFNFQRDNFSFLTHPLPNPSELQPRGLFFIIFLTKF
jgi:hypothetical protein